LYQGQTGGLQQQQLQALAELQSNIFGQQLTAEQQAASRNQAIQDALAALLGTGYINPEQITPTTITGTAPDNVVTTTQPKIVPPPVVQPKQSAPVAKLAAQVANATNKTLVNRANAFIAANPTATPAQVAKEFPSLTAAAKKKK
jgi:hypothetical protein